MAKSERWHKELEVLRLVWECARGQHMKMSVALLLEILIGLFSPAAIYLLQHAAGVNAGNLEGMLTQTNILYALVIYFVYILMTKLTRIMTAYAVAEVEYGMRMRFSESLKRMPYSEVSARLGLNVSNALTQEVAMASSLIPIVYKNFIRGGVTILAFCVLLVVIDPSLFLIVLGLTATVVLSIVVLRSRLKRIHKELYGRISSLYQYFSEWLSGYRVFRVYGSMDFAVNRMQGVFLTIRDMSRKLTVVANTQSAFAEMLTYGVAALIIVLMPDVDGIVDVSVLVSYPAAILFIRGELMGVINGYQQLSTTESSITRLFGVVSYHGADHRQEKCPKGNIGRIDLVDVDYSFRTPKGVHKVLDGVNVSFGRGRMYVLTGPSGAGKTTTLNLILGLLRPKEGEVRIEESDDGDRRGVALVEQEPYLFDGSIFENICMGRKDIPEERVMGYIVSLGLGRLVPDTDALHSRVEKLDSRLSSGEKQRIALIRALVGNPSLLVLDEVTSSMDMETSLLITRYLHGLAREMLVVSVSHDPDFIASADVVYRLEKGRYLLIRK